MSADNKKVVSNENLAAFAEALAAKVPLKSDIPTKVSDLQNDLGFTDNPGTITSVTLNGTTTSSGGVDLGYLVVQEGGKGLSSNDYTSLEKSKLEGIESGAQVNTIESISVNETTITPVNKAVEITVPTMLSDLSDDATHRFVTDAEKTAWSGKQNALTFDSAPTENSTNPVTSGGLYTVITQNEYVTAAAINDLEDRVSDIEDSVGDITVPTKVSDLQNDSGFTSNTGTLTGVSFNGTSASVSDGVASITASIPNVSEYFDEVEYDSQTKRINFKHGNTIKKYIDATDFIKDGMVDDVEIATPESGDNSGVLCLVVTFNTDAGKEDIEIPISSIFNANNYYTKTESDNKNLWVRSDGARSVVLKNRGLVTSANEVVVGKYNYCPDLWEEGTENVFTVGVGTDDDGRRNALVVKEDGKVYLLNAGYNLSEEVLEVPEEPEEPVEEEESAEDFKVRVRLADSNIPTPSYMSCDDGYGEEGPSIALDTVVDTCVHRPSCSSLYFQARINGTLFSSSIRYFDLQPYPTVNDITLYDDGDGGYYFELDYYPVTINVHPGPGVPAPSWLYYGIDGEEDGFSINTNRTFRINNAGLYLGAIIGGTNYETEFSYNELQPYPAVNDIYIYERTGGSGYYFDVTEPVEEEPVEEGGVMPADGMDPNAGGGEDIVPDDPGDGEEPLEEVPEEVEEEPEEVEEPENTTPLRSMKKAPLMRGTSNNTNSYPVFVNKDDSVQENITSTYTDSVVSNEPISFDEEFYVLQGWGTDEQTGEEWEDIDFHIDIKLNGSVVASANISYDNLSQQGPNFIYISKNNGEFDIQLEVVPEEVEELEDEDPVLVGYLQSDSSKKAYSYEEPSVGASVYSDLNVSTPAVNGHYISYVDEILSFDVTNGKISNIEYQEVLEEVPEEVEEISEENRERLVLDLATAVRQGYFGRAQVYDHSSTAILDPEEVGNPYIGDVFGVETLEEVNNPMPNDAKVPYFILPNSECDILRLQLVNNTTRNFSISGNQVIFATFDYKKYKFLSNPAPIVIGNPQPDWNATTGPSVIKNKPTIPSAVTESTVSGWGFTKNSGTLTGVKVNGSNVTVTDGVADVGTVITSHQDIKTINNQTITGTGNVTLNTLPSVSSSDNGKILQVVNGAWALITPASLYSGTETPSNSLGNNGDIYLQT